MEYFACIRENLENYCKRNRLLFQELDVTSNRKVWLLYDEHQCNKDYYIAIRKEDKIEGLLFDILKLDFELQVRRVDNTFLTVINQKELINKASKMAIFIESLDDNRYHCPCEQ